MSTVISRHFDQVAPDYDYYKKKNKFYYQNLKRLLSKLILANKIVLEIGCGTGDLLAYVKPKKGYGIDISPEMIRIAKKKHKRRTNLYFSTKPITGFTSKKIDYIFMSDVIEHLPDPQLIFRQISQVMGPDTVFINTMANPLWEPILMLAEKLGMKMPEGEHKRHPSNTVNKMFKKAGLRILNNDRRLLIPFQIPYITRFFNSLLEPYLRPFAFIEYSVCQKKK